MVVLITVNMVKVLSQKLSCRYYYVYTRQKQYIILVLTFLNRYLKRSLKSIL